MNNVSKPNYQMIKELYEDINVEKSSYKIRRFFSDKDGNFSVFNVMSSLDTMAILLNNEEETTRYISFSNHEEKNYLVLSSSRTPEQMRFDAACMLKELSKRVEMSDKNFCLNLSMKNKKFSREDKHFACALLMPRDELITLITKKDDFGNYLYLDENQELPFKNVHFIANHFGVPYNQCLSRIYYVLEDYRLAKGENIYLKGCYDKKDYRRLKANYSDEQKQKDLEEVVPDYQKNRMVLVKHLIDSLHYRSWNRLSDLAKHKILVNLVKFDSVNEGVVSSEQEAKAIINNYIASGGTVYKGKLITDSNERELSDEQLVVLGEYDLYNKTLERGLICGMAKSNPRLSYLLKMDYKEAINSLKEKDLTNYICSLHERLFDKLSNKYKEQRGGMFRNGPVKLAGTDVNPPDPYMIPQLMDNLSWRILDILKKNINGSLSNSEYIEAINECIYEMIRMQPFGDGNKRTARLLSNILYQEKGIPYVIVSIADWDSYIDAWSNKKMDNYNLMMYRLILQSYNYFYGEQTVNDVTRYRNLGQRIIMANRDH